MIVDIYNRSTNDPNYIPYVIEHNNELEALLTQIQMIFNTKPGEVLGFPSFGSSLEEYLFDNKLTAAELKEDIQSQFFMFIPQDSRFEIEIEVKFGKGEESDIVLIDIIINGKKELSYMFS